MSHSFDLFENILHQNVLEIIKHYGHPPKLFFNFLRKTNIIFSAISLLRTEEIGV